MTPDQIAQLTELIKVIFYGIATLCVPLATVYIMVGAARAKRADDKIGIVSKQIDGLLVARDAAKVLEGVAAAEAASERNAALLARGQQEGRDHERERAFQTAPVAEENAVAVATDRVADETKRIADVATTDKAKGKGRSPTG